MSKKNETNKQTGKRYEDLEFTDDFMFCKIMQNNPDLCKELTELIIGRKIGTILQTEHQKSIEITADGKGVRFDVYFPDDTDTVYDIEMQTTTKKDLPKRTRYYQAMIDLNIIERGAKYTELKKSYIIFICLENPYDKAGLHKYTFENICKEAPELVMGDEATKVFLSADGSADDISNDLKDFLDYLSKKTPGSDFTRRLNDEVRKAREHKQWRQEYMTLLEKYQEEREAGREEGLKEGLKEGELRTVIDLVCKKSIKGYNVSVIADMLEKEEDFVQKIYDAAAESAPDYDIDSILEKVK